jgi:hypothetical protein
MNPKGPSQFEPGGKWNDQPGDDGHNQDRRETATQVITAISEGAAQAGCSAHAEAPSSSSCTDASGRADDARQTTDLHFPLPASLD